MARFPCTRCGQRYNGRQQTAYPAIVDGNDQERKRMRLCPNDFQELESWLGDHLQDGTADDETGASECVLCSTSPAPLAIFVTVYAKGEERSDWYGRLCPDCRPAARMVVFGTETAP